MILPFRYIAGDPSLDFVNTVDWTEKGLTDERLPDYERLTRWADGANIISPHLATALRARATQHPTNARSALTKARRLRSLLQRVFAGVARGRIAKKDMTALNEMIAAAARRRKLVVISPRRARWEWQHQERDLDAMLWPVVWSAASLLSGGEVSEIRICDGRNCGWMFVDRSRNHFRRWCQMETCGTREKSRRRAEGLGSSARSLTKRPTASP